MFFRLSAIAFLLLPVSGIAQMFGPPQVIHQFIPDTYYIAVEAADMDGDGDNDIVFANEDSIILSENVNSMDGNIEHVIFTTSVMSFSVTDMDSDQDLDLLIHRFGGYGIGLPPPAMECLRFVKNLGALQFQNSWQVDCVSSFWSYCATDFEGDTISEVLASFSGNPYSLIIYDTNDTGSSDPWSAQSLFGSNSQARTLASADLDGDGDPDIAAGYDSQYGICWFENLTGDSVAPPQVISMGVDFPTKVIIADLNGDGMPDIASASSGDDKIAWYENLGGGSFGPQQVISDGADEAKDLFAIDLDNDTDIDLLSASRADNMIAWYENLGNGVFGPEQVICDTAMGARSVHAADLDMDGDIDVLSASSNDGRVVWYENLMIVTDVREQARVQANIYPNPFSGSTTVQFNGKIRNGTSIVITDLLGRPVKRYSDISTSRVSVDARETGRGFFLVYLETGKGERAFLGKLVVQ